MFHKARLKLTVWYLLIIMLISVMFSFTIYRLLTNELEREYLRISDRYIQLYGPQPLPDPTALQAAEDRVRNSLIYINLIILGVAGIGGYILAGVTLKPIQEMLDEQNRFIADASHELRTPLTSLKSEIEVYLRGKNQTIGESNTILKSNLEEVNKLQYLSDSLIQLSHQEKAQNKSFYTEVSLEKILQTSVDKLRKAAKQKEISLDLITKDYIIIGHRETLIQLFGILIDNAIKYSPKKSRVKVSTKKTDHTIAISVADEGIGIEKADIPHIFDRFYRADVSRSKQETPGYGLGLSIAKNIAEAHKATITVKSSKGNGSIFTVHMPASR